MAVALQQVRDSFRNLRVRRRDTGRIQRPQCMACLEFHDRVRLRELRRPLPVRPLKLKNARGVTIDLLLVSDRVDLGQRKRLVTEIDRVFHFALRDQVPETRVFGVCPRVPCHLVSADQGRLSVGLVGWKLLPVPA